MDDAKRGLGTPGWLRRLGLTGGDPVWARTATVALVVLHAATVALTFRDYGVTIDEPLHARYGAWVVRWYASGFTDWEMLWWTNIARYGGYYDVISTAFGGLVDAPGMDARHLLTGWVGSLGLIAAYLLGTSIGGRVAGFLSALLLVLTPRYFGHAFNNPKDIPFAVAYLAGIYGLVRCARHGFRWKDLAIAGVLIGFVCGIRVHGMFLAALALPYFTLVRFGQPGSLEGKILRSLRDTALVFVVGYVLMLVFWPWAQLAPLTRPFEALSYFSKFPAESRVLYDGQYINSLHLPRSYAPWWLLLVLPEAVLLGTVALIVVLVLRFRRTSASHFLREHTGTLLVLAAAGIPIAGAVISRTPFYDGIRHLLFTVPPMVVLAGTGVRWALSRSRGRLLDLRVGAFAVLCAVTLVDIVRLHPYQSLYFNRAFGGGTGAGLKRYDGDYWGNAYREAVRWVEAQSADTDASKVSISFPVGSAAANIRSDRLAAVEVPYDADFYASTTDGDLNLAVSGELVHEVEVDGTVILQVRRPDGSRAFGDFPSRLPEPFLAASRWLRLEGDLSGALGACERALAIGPPTGDALKTYGDLLRAAGRPEAAADQYRKAIEIGVPQPANFQALGEVLMVDLRRFREAEDAYARALQLHPDRLNALYNLSILRARRGDFDGALPGFLRLIEMGAGSAPACHYNAGLIYVSRGEADRAIAHFKNARREDPGIVQASVALGRLLIQEGRSGEAIDPLRAASRQAPSVSVFLDLASAYAAAGRLREAVEPLRKALELEPANAQVLGLLKRVQERIGATK